MLQAIRINSFLKILWGVLAIFLLNISVDSADKNPNHVPENLAFNDQESIVEIVVEQILGYENAIPEFDDNDTEDHTKKNNIDLDLISYIFKGSAITRSILSEREKVNCISDFLLPSGYLENDTPPPKVLI